MGSARYRHRLRPEHARRDARRPGAWHLPEDVRQPRRDDRGVPTARQFEGPAASGDFVAQVIGRALRDRAKVNGTEGQRRRPGERQEVRDDQAERIGLVPDSLQARTVCLGDLRGIDQAGVAMDGGETVAELVSEARRQLAKPGKAVLQPQLLLEADDNGQVREEADGPSQGSVAVAQRRHAHPEVQRSPVGRLDLHGFAGPRLSGRQNTIDEIEGGWRDAGTHELASWEIGESVMRALKKLDEVAYIRFASVYREFKDVNDFVLELKKLLSSEKAEKASE